MSSSSGKKLFITVGTTEFDELVKVVDTLEFLETASASGFGKLILQHGRGTYEPQILIKEDHGLKIDVEVYRFKPTLDDDMSSADLIISHCGAGSILEAVKNGKDLIVVVNNTLQGNHQTELADAMSSAGYCTSTEPSAVIETLQAYSSSKERQDGEPSTKSISGIPITDPSHFAKALSDMYEFST